jgi:hypothetical protein
MKDKILDWFAHGERGISSEAMACAVADIKPIEKWVKYGNHPLDPDDFKRCVKFLDAVPEARQHMNKVAALSNVWARLIEHWDELEALFREEYQTNSAPRLYKRMPRLYERMKNLGC